MKFEVNCEVDLLNDVDKYLILLQHLLNVLQKGSHIGAQHPIRLKYEFSAIVMNRITITNDSKAHIISVMNILIFNLIQIQT